MSDSRRQLHMAKSGRGVRCDYAEAIRVTWVFDRSLA